MSTAAFLHELHNALDEHYRDDTEEMNVNFLPLKSVWAVKASDEHWYRGEVQKFSVKHEENGKPLYSVSMLFVDYGVTEDVPLSSVRCLDENFTLEPPTALKCCLAGVYPLDGFAENPWSEKSIEYVKKNTSSNDEVLLAVFVSKNRSCTWEVILETGQFVVNEQIVKENLAKGSFFENFSFEKSDDKVAPPSPEENTLREELESWNPLEENFLATDSIDDECALSALHGFKPDDANICRNFQKNGRCPRGDTCRYVHKFIDPENLPGPKEVASVFLEVQSFPEVSSVIPAIVTSVAHNGHCFLVFPFGLDGRDNGNDDYNQNVGPDELHLFLKNHYTRAPSHVASNHITPGELLVLCEEGQNGVHWWRVRVLDRDEDNFKVEVYYIDLGCVSWVHEMNLHKFNQEFLQYQAMAYSCYFDGIRMKSDESLSQKEITKQLSGLLSNVCLFAKITDVDDLDEILGVILYDTRSGEAFDINQALVDQGFAVKLECTSF